MSNQYDELEKRWIEIVTDISNRGVMSQKARDVGLKPNKQGKFSTLDLVEFIFDELKDIEGNWI